MSKSETNQKFECGNNRNISASRRLRFEPFRFSRIVSDFEIRISDFPASFLKPNEPG